VINNTTHFSPHKSHLHNSHTLRNPKTSRTAHHNVSEKRVPNKFNPEKKIESEKGVEGTKDWNKENSRFSKKCLADDSRKRPIAAQLLQFLILKDLDTDSREYGVFQFAGGGEDKALLKRTFQNYETSRLADFAEALAGGKFTVDLKM
ncbi:protein kinase superfamily protein, partial [Striga asiatica]